MILAGLSTFYSSHGDWQTTALFPLKGFNEAVGTTTRFILIDAIDLLK